MKLIKIGCIVLTVIVAVIAAIGVALYFFLSALSSRSNSAPAPVPARSTETRTIPAPPKAAASVDPFQEKYGLSESGAELASSAYAKSIVRGHLGLRENHVFPWTSQEQTVFEFEKRDNSGKLIGEWVGVNLKNYVEKDGRRYNYSGTFHYDPAAKKWYCGSFIVDGKSVSAVLQ